MNQMNKRNTQKLSEYEKAQIEFTKGKAGISTWLWWLFDASCFINSYFLCAIIDINDSFSIYIM